jgi:hypothetical protein
MTTRSIRLATCVAAAGLALAASDALATEGPPTGAPQLPNTLQPVTLPQLGPPPAARKLRPSVRRARVVPRRVRAGHRSRLRVQLAMPGKVRIIVARRSGRRVWTRTVTARTTRLVVRLPRLHAGRYRVIVRAYDGDGARSRAVRRALVVTRR